VQHFSRFCFGNADFDVRQAKIGAGNSGTSDFPARTNYFENLCGPATVRQSGIPGITVRGFTGVTTRICPNFATADHE